MNKFTTLKNIVAFGRLCFLALGVLIGTVQAGTDTKEINAPAADPAPTLGSSINGLLNLEFSDKYYTPRGLTVTTKGAVFQPLLILFFDLYKDADDPKHSVNDVTFNLGVWNDVDTWAHGKGAPGSRNGNWDEIDGFFGSTVKFCQDWKFDATETFFQSQTQSYQTSTNFDSQLTYSDHWFGDSGFSINPRTEVFVETSRKATVAVDYASDKRGYYGVLAMDPTYKFKSIPLTLELPTFTNICSDSFYQKFDHSGGGAGFALVSTELKATTPLSFIPISYGAWSFYAGAQYYHLWNPGLLDGNEILTGNTNRPQDLYQLHTGLTCFF